MEIICRDHLGRFSSKELVKYIPDSGDPEHAKSRLTMTIGAVKLVAYLQLSRLKVDDQSQT
jgi:hypothetical protein